MMLELGVSEDAFEYLKVQRGRIADLADDREAWEGAYRRELAETYHHIAPHLPERCEALIDIGSGLGGIGVLISRHYGSPSPNLWLLDGEADDPTHVRHDRTFNDMDVARQFLAANGVHMDGFYTPELLGHAGAPQCFDLIVSFQAWGFHIEPSVYIPFAKARLAPGARVILDVRRGRPAWLGQLMDAFAHVATVHRAPKFDRMVFAARA